MNYSNDLDEICLNQLIRPTTYIPIEGVGDCTKCIKDEKNKDCRRYIPIHVNYYEIRE